VFNGSEECTRLLLTSEADVEIKNNDGQTALQLAAANKHTVIMTLLVLGPSA
jgi:ankyrin repeat protein